MTAKKPSGNIGINIQGGDKAQTDATAQAIIAVIQACDTARLDGKTVRAALLALEKALTINGVHVSNSSISMGAPA